MAILLPSFSLRFARSSPGITGRTAIAAQLHQRPIRHSRLLSASLRTAYPRKDSQDRESINTDATEYSKSGSDDGAAAQERAAFEPGRADPYEAMQEAGKGTKQNPLEVSPANHEVSKPRSSTEGGAESSAGTSGRAEQKGSGGGSPSKGKKLQ